MYGQPKLAPQHQHGRVKDAVDVTDFQLEGHATLTILPHGDSAPFFAPLMSAHQPVVNNPKFGLVRILTRFCEFGSDPQWQYVPLPMSVRNV